MSPIKKGYLYASAAVLIWSGFILVSRLGGISELLPNDIIAIRYFTCAVILLPLWWFKYRFNLFQWPLILCSLIGGLAYALCTFRGFALAPASHAAVLLPGLMPLLIIVLTSVINGERHSYNQWLGVGIITVGVLSLLWQPLMTHHHLSEGHFWLVSGALCWAVLTVLIKHWALTPWQVTVSLALGSCLMYLPVYIVYLPKHIFSASIKDIVLQSIYQGFLATIVQMFFYVRAVQLIGPSSMGAMMALVPIVSGLSAIAFFDEPLTTGLIVGLIAVSSGAWLAHSQWIKNKWRSTPATS